MRSLNYINDNAYIDRDNNYIIITPSTEDALVLANVKAWLRLDVNSTSEDSILKLLVAQAVAAFESISRRTLMNTGFQTFRTFWLCFYELRKSKLVSIESLSYEDEDEITVVVDPSNYYTNSEDAYSSLIFNENFDFPSKSNNVDSIQISFTAGLAATTALVPTDIQIALMQYIMFLYENRGDCACDDVSSIPASAKRVFKSYQIIEIGA